MMPPNPRLLDEERYHNRVHIGQIQAIREDEGIISVRLLSGSIHKMPIPVYGFSPPIVDVNGNTVRGGARSSWMRYMPQVGDYVKVGYGADNRPEALGAATWGDLPSERGPPGQLGGYAQVSRLRDEGQAGLETFYALRQGEWDMRSSGNAYIRGGRYGTLFLAGGGVTVQLKKEQEELNARAGLYRLESVGTELRLGDVKRTPVGGYQLEPVTGATKELDLRVGVQGTTAEYFRLRCGDLRSDDSAAVVERSSEGNALHFREEVLDGLPQTGQPVPYVREIDAAGNIREVQGASATSHSVTGSSVAEYSRSGYLRLTYQAATDITLDSARVALGSSSASSPVPLGDQLVAAIQSLTVPTALGPSGVPINSAAFLQTLSTKVFVE